MKRNILKTVMILLVITLLSAPFAPIASYATSRAINFSFRTNNAKVVDNSTVKKVESSKNTSTSSLTSTVKQTTNNTATQTVKQTTSNPATSTVKQTSITKQKVDVVKLPATTVVPRVTEQEVARSQALERVLETVKANTEKAVEEVIAPKKDGLEGIETSLNSVIYRNFAENENVEVNSKIIYTFNLKNTTANTKTLHIKVTMPESVLGTETVAKIVDVDRNVGDSEVDFGYRNEQVVSYKGLINIEMSANSEKAVIVEQDIVRYVMPELTTTFTVVCAGSVRNLSDTKHALTPAKINAELKLLVNDKEVETGKTVELKDKDIAKYVITVVNTGETAEALNILEILPRTFRIVKVENLENSKKTTSSEEYDGSTFNILTSELKQNEIMQIALTVEPNINGEHSISTFAEIKGTHIKELSTNVLENTFICDKTNVKGFVIKDEMFEKPVATRGNTDTQTILNYFQTKGLEMKFKAYADYNGTQLGNYSYQNMNANFYIPFDGLFRRTKDMFCLNMGHSYYRDLKIENFYTVYGSDIYRYMNGNLVENQLPSSGIGIGNSYNNLLNTHYNELSYILSQVDSTYFGGQDFYKNVLGINYNSNWERPDHSVSPVQVAIWRLEGATDTQLINRIRTRLSGTLNIANTARQNTIIDEVMKRSAMLSAYAKAYDAYIENIGREPTIELLSRETINVNDKTLVGPFKVMAPESSRSEQVYTKASGGTATAYGVYGEIREVKVKNNGEEYDKLYNVSGAQINIGETNSLEFYIDIKNKDFRMEEETTVDVTMNNQYRNAYVYTLKSRTYDNGQHVLIGRGTYEIGYYQEKIPGIEIVEYMTLSGFVWHDKQTGIKSPNTNPKTTQPPNGVFDPDNEEELLPGIKVYLIDETTNKKVAETVTNSNGAYEFKDVVKSEYSILMAFNGMKHEVSRAVADETDETRTKVAERADGDNLREDFTDRFKRIEHNKKIDTKFILNETTGEITNLTMPENEQYQLEYNVYPGPFINESVLVTEENGIIKPVYIMYAKTTENYSETTNNINMGLKAIDGDLAIRFGNTEVKGSFNNKATKADSTITYMVEFINDGITAIPSVQKVDFYYDPMLEFIEADFTYRSSTTPITEKILDAEERDVVVINGRTFNKITIDIALGLVYDANLKVKFRLEDNRNLRAPLTAYAEIAQYSMSGGAVDKDSEPGNGITENGSIFYEDDFTKVEIESLLSTLLRKQLGLIKNP